MGYKMQPNYYFYKFYAKIHHIYAFHTTKKFKWFLSQKLLSSINVHNIVICKINARSNEPNDTQTMAHAYTYVPPQTHTNIVPCLAGPNCRESVVI